jgi:predicted nuclease of restriction endonuclease-like RecB superfamily
MKFRRRVTYRSGLEDNVHEQLTKKKVPFEYEPFDKKIVYIVPESVHKYTPDFVLTTASGKTIYVETKGIWDSDDRKKHLLIRQQHPSIDIRFVFTRSKARIRKGSKTTYACICQGKGRGEFKNVVWQYADKLVPIEWLKE